MPKIGLALEVLRSFKFAQPIPSTTINNPQDFKNLNFGKRQVDIDATDSSQRAYKHFQSCIFQRPSLREPASN